tara:strand:+ start:156 stop:383 length:228 start_codon:yes stop_codon:yes gene_type:complete
VLSVRGIRQQQQTGHAGFEHQKSVPIGTQNDPFPEALDRLNLSSAEFFSQGANQWAYLNGFQVTTGSFNGPDGGS